jgi:hypothetical protein
MAQSPVSPTIKGLTTIVWGTNPGGSANMLPIGIIVERGSVKPKNGGPVAEIENGDGSEVCNVYLDDGFDADVTAVYDTALTYPAVGDTVVFKCPSTPAAGSAAAAGAASKSYNTILQAMPELESARKTEAKISFKLRFRPGVLA